MNLMSLKSTPCSECRKQHRKCLRLAGSKVCKRCDKLELRCVVPTLDDDNQLDEVVDGSKQLKQMRTTVDLLEETIQQWELELDHYRSTGSASPDTAVGTSMIVSKKPMQRHSRALSDTNSISSSSTTSTNDDHLTTCCSSHDGDEGDDLLVLSQGKEWQVTLANGQWRIDTHINTHSDLDQLNQRHHQPFLYRMPLPFQGVQVNTPIIIDACDERSLFPVTAKLAREYLMRPGKPALLITNGQLFPPPRRLLDNPRYVIDKLVRMYFAHYNESLAVLYEPRYMAYYQQLANPLDCPVTMALCSMVCCGHDDHLFAAATDGDELFACQVNRRAMGEFFYRHCRAILEHIFDDPERRLETVMAINLLKRFLMNTLRISEMRKLEMIGYLICLDLISSSSSTDDNVERELGVRHYLYSVWCRVTLDFFMDSISWQSDLDFVAMGRLPGESDTMWRFLDVQNRLFQIFIHPSIGNVFRRVQNTMLGDKVELTMEMILQFDRVMKQWWQDLPSELRLCDDPYDFNTVMAMVYQTQDDVKLTILLFFLDLVGSFHSCLIKIETRAQDALTLDHDIMALIQEKSIKASLDFSEILVLVVNRIDTNVAYTQFLGDAFLFVAVDVLASLTFSDDPVVSLKAKQKLYMCFSALDTAGFMNGHRVPLASSPLNSHPLNSNIFYLYNEYPQPRYALLYDICRFLSPIDYPPSSSII